MEYRIKEVKGKYQVQKKNFIGMWVNVKSPYTSPNKAKWVLKQLQTGSNG